MEYIKIKLNHLLLSLFCIIVLLACNSQSKKEYLLLSPEQFDQRIENESNPQIIDVRTSEEFVLGSIYGSVNYNISDGTFEKNTIHLDPNKTVFVYCQKGGRSARAAKLLEERGFQSVIDLKGGFSGWDGSR